MEAEFTTYKEKFEEMEQAQSTLQKDLEHANDENTSLREENLKVTEEIKKMESDSAQNDLSRAQAEQSATLELSNLKIEHEKTVFELNAANDMVEESERASDTLRKQVLILPLKGSYDLLFFLIFFFRSAVVVENERERKTPWAL